MSKSNTVIFVASFIISIIFFASVFVNLQIKTIKLEVNEIYEEIDELKQTIKRQRIEITTLTNPHKVLEYIEENQLTPLTLDQVNTMQIKITKKE
ncbi:MAG: hypothetical protein MJB14_22385 [Spirochaetes bacterium]|nr:hypothetical protein [Spirochaetota bacterium]